MPPQMAIQATMPDRNESSVWAKSDDDEEDHHRHGEHADDRAQRPPRQLDVECLGGDRESVDVQDVGCDRPGEDGRRRSSGPDLVDEVVDLSAA